MQIIAINFLPPPKKAIKRNVSYFAQWRKTYTKASYIIKIYLSTQCLSSPKKTNDLKLLFRLNFFAMEITKYRIFNF